jgi:hypothetical protein
MGVSKQLVKRVGLALSGLDEEKFLMPELHLMTSLGTLAALVGHGSHLL